MKAVGHKNPADYLEFNHEGVQWRVNLSFLLSKWNCTYGDTCAGHFSKDSKTFKPDIGCCTIGAWFSSEEDFEHTAKMVEELTDAEWQPELRKAAEKGGWYSNKNIGSKKTRVYQGGCIFNNRAGQPDGLVGCAFHKLAERKGIHFVETKPEICWQVPLHYYTNEDDDVEVIDVHDSDEWGGLEDDGTHDSFMCWSCVDSPDAYLNSRNPRVYQSMEMELRKLMTDGAYEKMVQEIGKRIMNYVAPMAAELEYNGKPVLPLLTIGKKPERPFGAYH